MTPPSPPTQLTVKANQVIRVYREIARTTTAGLYEVTLGKMVPKNEDGRSKTDVFVADVGLDRMVMKIID